MTPEGIVDWERDAPQWPVLLEAARGRGGSGAVDSLLWQVYGPLVGRTAREAGFVLGQVGQSLDGRIATSSGHSHYINGPSAILHLHRLRALVDAVVIGVGTAIADDPQLTVRQVKGPQPARVVIDPSGRLPASARCMLPDGIRRIVVSSTKPSVAGVEHVRLLPGVGGFAPGDIVTALRDLGFHRLLIEGGGQTVSRFLDAGCLDRLHVMVSPMIIGAGPVGLSFGALTDLKDAIRFEPQTYTMPGGDMLFDCALKSKDANV